MSYNSRSLEAIRLIFGFNKTSSSAIYLCIERGHAECLQIQRACQFLNRLFRVMSTLAKQKSGDILEAKVNFLHSFPSGPSSKMIHGSLWKDNLKAESIIILVSIPLKHFKTSE